MSRVLVDSGVNWLGKIPDSWSTCRVKNKFLFHKIIAKERSVNYDRIALKLNGVIKRDKDDSNGLQPDNYNGYQVVYKDDLIFKLIDLENVNTTFDIYPLGIIICDNFHIITVSLIEHEFLNSFVNGDVETFFTYKKTRFLIQIFLKSAEVYLNTLSSIDEDIQKQEKVTYKSTSNRQLINFLNIQKTLVYFITSLQANGHVLEKLHREDILPMYEEDKMLLEDAMIENKQCIEMSTIYRDILDSTMDTYGTIISNNLNVIMKVLAGITIVFSIPTMISSFLGMNVPLGFLEDFEFAFLAVCVVSFLLSFLIACWLKKKDML